MAVALRCITTAPTPDLPDRDTLREELIALHDQYQEDRRAADSIISGYERILLCARAERNLAEKHLVSIEQLLNLEYPGWSVH